MSIFSIIRNYIIALDDYQIINIDYWDEAEIEAWSALRNRYIKIKRLIS